MTESSRRSFLKTSAVGAATIAGTSGVAIHSVQAQTSNSQTTMALKANEISKKLFVDDGLAIEIAEKPTISKLATGLDMANIPEMVVGTSAGSYMGSSLLSGEFARLRTEFEFFGKFPEIFARIAPVTKPNISQQRADFGLRVKVPSKRIY